MPSSCCGLCEGGAVFKKEGSRVRGGVRRPHALPAEVRARGAVASSSGFVYLLAHGTRRGPDRTASLARRPYHGCRSRPGQRVRQLCCGVVSLYAPFLRPTRTPACMHGEETGLPEERRRLAYITAGGDEASFTSGVPHHTPPDLPVSAAPSSHTHPLPSGGLVKGDIKGQGDDDDIRGGGSRPRHIPPPPPKRHPVLQPPPPQECYLPQPGSSGSEWAGIPLRATLPLARHPEPGQRNRVLDDKPQPTTGNDNSRKSALTPSVAGRLSPLFLLRPSADFHGHLASERG